MHLINLYNDPAVNRISQFAAFAEQLPIDTLCNGYRELLRTAPRRHKEGRSYLEGRTGRTSTGSYSNRGEEHLAVAIYNAHREDNPLALPDGRNLVILDYQTPLKAQQSDAGIGKVDLFGVIDGNLPGVIELKVTGSENNLSDTPLRALLEGFAYCALVEANGAEIAGEALARHETRFSTVRPALLVMAPEDYWRDYLDRRSVGSWYPTVRGLAKRLAAAMAMEIHLLVLRNSKFQMGLNRKRPRLEGILNIISVDELAP